ncbi:MAG: NEW3 domain-containing protein [bacterium]
MKSKLRIFLISVAACVGLSLVLVGSGLVVAQSSSGQPAAPERFELQPKFPVMTGPADATFEFKVGIMYNGDKARVFDLNVSGPQGWLAYVAQSTYEKDKRLSAIRLEQRSLTEEVVVVAVAPYWLYPEPKEYSIEVEAISQDGELQDTATLSAKIDPQYSLSAETTTGRYSTKATAGDRTSVAILLTNSGTAVFDSVTFSADSPDVAGEWEVSFDPSDLQALGPGDEREIEVTIAPPEDMVPGDYMVTLNFDTDPLVSEEPPSLDVRVTVGGSTPWGWIVAGVVVLVIAAVVFWLRSRRDYGT